jgi:hypothetical protein
MDIFDDIVKYSLYIENEVFHKGAPALKDFINGYFLLWYHLLNYQSLEDGDENFVILESVRLSLLLFAATVRRFLSISTYSTAEQLRKLRHIISMHEVDENGPLFRLRIWMVSMGFFEAVQESDVLWWARLWVETLAQAWDAANAPKLEDFDWKDGFAFVKKDSADCKTVKKSKKHEEVEQDEVATTISSVIWLSKLQGERYREACDRVDEILKSRETCPEVKNLVERPVGKQLSN